MSASVTAARIGFAAAAAWLWPLWSSAATAAQTVHEQNFEGVIGPEWSLAITDTAPADGRRFLGQFNNDIVRLRLHGLPEHEYVRISFDLLILYSWDGNDTVHGPDFWTLNVTDGPTLVWATFSNIPIGPFRAQGRLQTYPSPLPGASVPAMTGAAEVQTLGYIMAFSHTAKFPMDSVYRIDLTFPHTAESIEFNFADGGLDRMRAEQPFREAHFDESWALDNVIVQVLSGDDVPRPPADRLEELLEQAIGDDAMAANEAFWALVVGGEPAAVFLRRQIELAGIDRGQIRETIGKLADPDEQVHRQVAEELKGIGVSMHYVLEEALRPDLPMEVRTRAAELFRELSLEPIPDAAHRRAAIAAGALVIMGHPQD